MIVCKFGGSSVADADQLRKVKAIIESNTDRKIVIVSAPGKRNKEDIKVTDLLYASNKAALENGNCSSVFSKVRQRYLDILKDLDMDTAEMETFLDEVEKNIDAKFGSDYAASRGEYLNAKLVSIYLGWNFVDATDLIVINENGTVNDKTWNLTKNKLSESENYVIPGFYGESITNKVKTFSRGGSDISGAIISKAVQASLYENWTDVAGCYNADPRYIEGAYPIAQMTYKEVRELSIVGASVFHSEAILPVFDAGIPINIKNTNKSEEPGTMISLTRDSMINPIIGVSAEDGFTRFDVNKFLLLKEPGIYNVMASVLKVHGISPLFSSITPDSICWFFPSSQVEGAVLDILVDRFIKDYKCNSVRYTRDLSIVGLIGHGILRESKALVKSINALNEKSIEVNFVNFGSSDVSLYIAVEEKSSRKAVQAIFDVIF